MCRGGNPRKRQNRRTKEVKPLEDDNENDSSDSDYYLYSLATPSQRHRKETPIIKVTDGGHKFAITVDTGASINVMDQETFSKLKRISLRQTSKVSWKIRCPRGDTQTVHDMHVLCRK